jgi:2,3-bisphosphoglycerate-independent phosphoglycerate mutase
MSMGLELERLLPPPAGPVVLCILDGVGIGRPDDGNAVFVAKTPNLDRLLKGSTSRSLRAHGSAVGLPSEEDMGNSEVGHNAIGAGFVVEQGASLVQEGLASGAVFEGEVWAGLVRARCLHLMGLLSNGNVHSHVDHLHRLIEQAHIDGVQQLRVHVLTDGRDVPGRSALEFIRPLEVLLKGLSTNGRLYCIASGGGRMHMTMDRYEADWEMLSRGWACHVRGEGERFRSASQAVQCFYDRDPSINDQWLPGFVIAGEDGEAIGLIRDGDSVLFTHFRGDRAVEISRAFEGRPVGFDRGQAPEVFYAGMMQYDGDEQIPTHFLVDPPLISRTLSHYLLTAGHRILATSETQKFGHVTTFFNGNCSGYIDEGLERYLEIPSDVLPFETAPKMKAREITRSACDAIASGRFEHIRLNLANGDMVGHTGDFAATVLAMEVVDACVGALEKATVQAGGCLIVTADHGNAEEMFQLDRKAGVYKLNAQGAREISTSHSLNPVPFVLVDPQERWVLADLSDAGIASIGSTLIHLAGFAPPPEMLPSLLRTKEAQDGRG